MDGCILMSTMDGKPGPNWLLRILVLLSVAVHAVIFMHISGIYRSGALSYIEMSLQDISKPAVRDIPRPRPRPKDPAPQSQVKKIDVVQRPLPHLKPLAMAPVEKYLPDSLMEGITAPDLPQTPGVDSAKWTPGPRAGEAAPEFMTAAGYLDMLRLKIESRKRYPQSAKTRGVEGRVTIRFVLKTDGSVQEVTIAKGSKSRDLNMAAMAAVQNAAPFPRPPSNIFKGDQPLELTIVFELT
jgi:periplasmic protein TonB